MKKKRICSQLYNLSVGYVKVNCINLFSVYYYEKSEKEERNHFFSVSRSTEESRDYVKMKSSSPTRIPETIKKKKKCKRISSMETC